MNTLIVIPCYNHNDLCNNLISKIKIYNILVIDDGSDIKFKIISSLNNSTLIRNEVNKGKGYCIKKGAQYAINNNYTHMV